MLRSLIKQLSIQSASTPQALKALFSSNLNGERQPRANELLATLKNMIQQFNETFIILDALDECKQRQELLAHIRKIVGWKCDDLHMLATIRREKDIEESLQPTINDQENTLCIQSALVNDDIRAYVHEELRIRVGLKRWRKEPKVQREIETALVNGADGM